MPIPQITEERVRQRTVKQTIDVPVPHVLEENVQVVQITHQERISGRIFTDCRCASASDLEEIVGLVRFRRASRGCVFSTDYERLSRSLSSFPLWVSAGICTEFSEALFEAVVNSS